MNALLDALMILINGLLSTVSSLISWPVLFVAATAVSLVWLARLEVDDVDVSSAKPLVGRH